MKNALMIIKDDNEPFDAKKYLEIEELFNKNGILLNSAEILSKSDLSISKNIENSLDFFDNLIICTCDDCKIIKDEIVSVLDTVLIENDVAVSVLNNLNNFNNENINDYSLLPLDCTVIPNRKGLLQGFMSESVEFTLAFLPNNLNELESMVKEFLAPYFINKYNLSIESLTLKYFGDIIRLKEVLKKAEDIYEKPFNNTFTIENRDITVKFLFESLDEKQKAKDAIRYLVGELKDDIYAETDTCLGERVFDLLRLKNKKISIAESFTAGRVVSEIIKNPGSSSFVNEGIVSYSNLSKHKRLGVINDDLINLGAVSSKVAYEMASGLLKTGDCDIAVATTGIAGPNSDDTLKPVGLCFIAVGDKEGIHVYKYNLKGDREEITETAKNIALFLTIKNLKKN